VGHGRANDTAWSPDGALLAVAAAFRVDLYNTRTWQRIGDLDTEARHVAFSPTEGVLAAASARTIRTYFVATRQIQYSLPTQIDSIGDLVYSPGGRWLAALGNDCGSCGDPNYVLQVWDTATGESLYTKSEYGAYSAGMAFSPDGRTLALGNEFELVLLDADSGQTLSSAKARALKLAFLRDGQLLGHLTEGGLGLLDPASGATLRALSMPAAEQLVASPDGYTIALTGISIDKTFNRQVQLWDVVADQPLALLNTATEGTMLAFSPDGLQLAVASYADVVEIWDATSGQRLQALPYNDGISSILIGPSRDSLPDWILTGGQDGLLQRWSPDTKQVLDTLVAAAMRPTVYVYDQTAGLVASGDSRGNVQVSSLTTGVLLNSLSCEGNHVGSLVFSPDGRRLAAGCSQVIVWELDTGKVVRRMRDGAAVALVADGNLISITASQTGWAVHDLESAQLVQEGALPPNASIDHITAWTYSADGLYFAAGASNGEALIWETQNTQPIHVIEAHQMLGGEGAAYGVEDLAFSPTGHLLATAGFDGIVRLWDAATGKLLHTLTEAGSPLSTITFSADGRWLAAAGWDGTAILWGLP
jgi:WD40 repeat protein